MVSSSLLSLLSISVIMYCSERSVISKIKRSKSLLWLARGTGDRQEVEALIDFYGIRQNTTYLEDLKPHEVNAILNRAKVNVVLSLQEGGNRCLFEGFFAGVPGLALKYNVGIRKDHFNRQTGKLISERDLARELLYFRDHWHTFSPRVWAGRNITPEISTAKLNAVVRKLALKGENRGPPIWFQNVTARIQNTTRRQMRAGICPPCGKSYSPIRAQKRSVR